MPDIVRQPDLEPIRFDPTVDPALREVTFRSPLSDASGPEWIQTFLEEMATGTEVSGFDRS